MKMPKPHTVYAVHWPTINVFKIGITSRNRWRLFVNRGADLLALMRFESYDDAAAFEHACHIAAHQACRPAFPDAEAARPYVSNGGRLECYKVPGDLSPSEILPLIDLQLAQFSDAGRNASGMRPAYAEENRREENTNGESFVTF